MLSERVGLSPPRKKKIAVRKMDLGALLRHHSHVRPTHVATMNVPTKELVKLLGLVRLETAERLTHKQRVTRMYKATLKTLNDWAIYRDVWSRAAGQAQKIFRSRQSEVNPVLIEQFCAQGESWLQDHQHPDPYIMAYRPGGTLYQRNEPLPAYVRLTSHSALSPSC
jgi:NADH dehydrogenase (ubiquinone) 1 beta subcomplex subunit 9